MSDIVTATPHAQLTSVRLVVMTVAFAPLVLAVVSWFVLDPTTPMVPVRLLIALGIVVGTAVVGRIVGLRVNPMPPSTPPQHAQGEAIRRIITSTFPAFALAELGGLLCLALGFVLPMSRISVALALVVSAAVTLWAALPSGSRLRGLIATLESEGARTGLTP